MTTATCQRRPPPSSLSSSVQEEETSRLANADTTYAQFRRSQHVSEWRAARSLYEVLYPEPNSRVLKHLMLCSTRAFFLRNNETGHLIITSNHCRLRWCPICAAARAWQVARTVRSWIENLNGPKFLTLTLKHSSTDLRSQLDRLMKTFTKLRGRGVLKRAWKGGVWFIQTTYNDDDRTWHPHLHVILDGDYVDQRLIAKKWLEVTGDSDIVDIRTVKNVQKAIRYVSRYVARPMKLSELDEDVAIALHSAFVSRRLGGTFGTGRKQRILQRPTFDHKQWTTVGDWFWVTTLASSDARANEILRCYQSNQPLSPDVTIFAGWCKSQDAPLELEPNPPPTQGRFSYD